MTSKVFPRLRFNVFESTLIVTIVAFTILEALLSGKANWWASVASIAGVLSVVLTAKGHLACYFFGFIQVCLYAFVSWQSKLYGEVILHALYFMPMQFVGFVSWRKNLGQQDLVKPKNMTHQERFLWLFITIIATLLCGSLLEYLKGTAPYWDAASTVLSIIAMVLMVRAYVEQWVLWIIINLITIIMWVIALINKEPNAVVMIVMWSLFLVNAIYGYLNWIKLSKNDVE